MDSNTDKSLAKQTHRADVGRLEVKWAEAERRVHEAVADYANALSRAETAKSVARSTPTDFHVKQAAQAAEALRLARAAVDQTERDAADLTKEWQAALKSAGMPTSKAKSIKLAWKPQPTPQPKKPTQSFSRYVRDQQKKKSQ